MAVYILSSMKKIERTSYPIGQRVHYTGDMANLPADGVIIGESGEEYYYVVLDDGRKNLHAHIEDKGALGARFYAIEGGVASSEEIANLLAGAERREAELLAKEKQEAKQYEKNRLRHLDEYPDLVLASDDNNSVAKNVRKLLKKAFPKVKFSVRKPHWGTLNISWTDGPTSEEVEAIANRFEGGHFNSMEDIYEYQRSAFTDLFGSAKYIFCNREHSDAAILAAIERVAARWHDGPAPSVDDFKKGRLFRDCPDRNSDDWQRLIRAAMETDI